MTTKQIELRKNTYVLTECDDLFKFEKGYIIELDKENELKELFINTVHKKPENGFIAEASRDNDVSESMSTIGG